MQSRCEVARVFLQLSCVLCPCGQSPGLLRQAVSLAPKRKTQALALLQEYGLRVTDQRLELVGEMLTLSRPASHAELTERLAKRGLDRATVYRNLVSLAEQGILLRVELGDHVWRYELRRNKTHSDGQHAHLVCNDCGEVECLPDDALKISGSAVARVAEVQLRGQCADCSE